MLERLTERVVTCGRNLYFQSLAVSGTNAFAEWAIGTVASAKEWNDLSNGQSKHGETQFPPQENPAQAETPT
jgi:hypothetical protein